MQHPLPSLLLTLTLAMLMSIPHPLSAQETDANTSEVDRILAEIDATAPAEATPAAPAVENPAPAAGPAAAPAILLEEAEGQGVESPIRPSNQPGLITISYNNLPLSNVIQAFARASEASIIIPEGLNMPVSANLNDVTWRDALEVILGDQGYALVERKAGIFTITQADRLMAEPLMTETLDLEFITADAALPAVKSLILSSNASVTAIPQTNVLIVSETPQRLQEIKRLVRLVDLPRKQVFIEAKFVELNDSAIKDLGINWQALQGVTIGASGMSTQFTRTETRLSQDAQAVVGSQTKVSGSPLIDAKFDSVVAGKNFESFDAEDGTIATVPSMQQEIIKSAVLSASDFALTLSALQQLDGVRIVSNPKMLVANGQTASIHVGRNEPNVRAIPQGENATTFAYVLDGFIEIGVKLEVTPVISTDKNITVSIIPELSRLIGEKTVGEAGTSFPITQIRRINTEFALESGKTVAIGGLTQTEDREVVKKIPLLGDLPIIGKYLFSHTKTEKFQDEIIIFVSVKTVHTGALNDREGIPEEGKLIHTWLDFQAAADQEKVKP